MAIEYERKYRATPELLQQLDAFTDGPRQLLQMHTTYYDTPTGQLSGRHYTLRTRRENGSCVCTLKAPAAGGGRGEWELLCEDIHRAIPELCKLGAPSDLPVLAQEGLIPVCGARFTRIAKMLVLPGGALELALDQGVLYSGRKQQPLCEIELELKEGSPALCDSYAAQLAGLFALVPEKRSKFRRALALYREE